MKKFLSSLLLVSSTLVFGVTDNRITSGSFKMYGQPGVEPNLGCDVYTNLIVDQTSNNGPVAFFTNFVGGFCELFVNPNPRFVFLTGKVIDRCGTATFQGRMLMNDGPAVSVKLTDNRQRVCEDVVAGQVVVELTSNGETRSLYSYDR